MSLVGFIKILITFHFFDLRCEYSLKTLHILNLFHQSVNLFALEPVKYYAPCKS